MIPDWAKDILFYYAMVTLVALIVILNVRRPRRGMSLKLGMSSKPGAGSANITPSSSSFREPVDSIRPMGERPLNVVFNYNGHSWDAYEVLGLPAGSSPDKVEKAFQESKQVIEKGSGPFLEAAYAAIQTQWKAYKASGE